MFKSELEQVIKDAVENLQKEGSFPEFEIPEILIETPKEKSYGDYSTNIALKISKSAKKNPMEIAEFIKNKIEKKGIKKIEIAVPGFINFFIEQENLTKELADVLKQKDKFGSSKIGNKVKVNVEFISANPTGPLTLGNGRGGFCGDVLANVLNYAGYRADKEYYVNDVGVQIDKLGHSVIGDSEAVYKGGYIEELREKLKPGNDATKVGAKSAKLILNTMIKPVIKKMGIKFDVWFNESKLKNQIGKALKELENKGLVYQKEGASWFSSTKFGDDKDRVLIKETGDRTYFTSDIAYLKDKFKRKYKKLIFFWGADHYGYVSRVKAAAEALGYQKENVEIIIMQLVHLFKDGSEVKMSKRAGTYVTIDELIDEVGVDVARFFFLARAPNSHLNFDMNLAKEQSKKNPVYYIEYAYARISSILKKANLPKNAKLELLTHESELTLIKQILRFPEIVKSIAEDYQVQRLPQYGVELADSFHKFYEDCRVITEDKELTKARLLLIKASQITFKNTFDLMGISAPEKM